LREDALLSVVFLTDQDDCSARDDLLFDDTSTALLSTMGPLTPYRCFEFGITCDENDRMHVGVRHECAPREDAGTYLHLVDRYRDFFVDLKAPHLLVLGAIAGPVTPSPEGVGHDAVVARDASNQPELVWSCNTPVDGAVPGIRLYNLLAEFYEEESLATWAYSSVCSADYTPIMTGVAERLRRVTGPQCLPLPLKGCADPGVDFGIPRAAQICSVNAQCLARCEVTDVQYHGLPEDQELAVPPCMEILPDGFRLEGNTDRWLAYAIGYPAERDPLLPVAACWYISYHESCPQSNYGEIVVSRPLEPPPRTEIHVRCQQIPVDEYQCEDGADNDEDCLTDQADPCCVDPTKCR